MKKFLGWLFIIVGILLGAYIGIWVLLAGGIIQIVNNLNPINALEIAIGVIRIIFSGIGWIPVCLGIILGRTILDEV